MIWEQASGCWNIQQDQLRWKGNLEKEQLKDKSSGIGTAHFAEREIMALLNPLRTFNTNSASAKTLAEYGGKKNITLVKHMNTKPLLYVNGEKML